VFFRCGRCTCSCTVYPCTDYGPVNCPRGLSASRPLVSRPDSSRLAHTTQLHRTQVREPRDRTHATAIATSHTPAPKSTVNGSARARVKPATRPPRAGRARPPAPRAARRASPHALTHAHSPRASALTVPTRDSPHAHATHIDTPITRWHPHHGACFVGARYNPKPPRGRSTAQHTSTRRRARCHWYPSLPLPRLLCAELLPPYRSDGCCCPADLMRPISRYSRSR